MPGSMLDVRRRTVLLVATGVWIAAATVAIAGAKVQAQADPKFDFATIKTFAFDPASPGQVLVVVSKDSKSEPVRRQYEPLIIQSIEEQFVTRGYTKASLRTFDFRLTYYLLITAGNSSQYMGQFLPANAGWGLPLFAPQTTALSYYPEGTLVVDAASQNTGEVFWRCVAQAKIDAENDEAKREARLKSVIKDLVSKFPKRKS